MPTTEPEPVALLLEEESLFARDFEGSLVRIDPVTENDFNELIEVEIDGQSVTVPKARPLTDSENKPILDAQGRPVPRATTIYDASHELFVRKKRRDNPIPVLCHQDHLNPVAVCRLCMVNISRKQPDGTVKKGRKLFPACQHRVEKGMVIDTIRSPDAAARQMIESHVKMLVELLAADHLRPMSGAEATNERRVPLTLFDRPIRASSAAIQLVDAGNELTRLAIQMNVIKPRVRPNKPDARGKDDSSVVIAVDHNLCILCDRCVRACNDVVENHVIGRTGKGYTSRIGFDLNDPMGRSSCVACGECMISCPTGALTFKATPPIPTPADGSVVEAHELLRHPMFRGISYRFLQFNRGSVVRRRIRSGEILCREGEFGSTAFLLESGRFQVTIRPPAHTGKKQRASGVLGLLGRVTTRLTGVAGAAVQPFLRRGGWSLQDGRPVAVLTKDHVILGEMTCLNNYPRSATVTALEDSEVLEIRRNVLYMLQRNKAPREILDRVYRQRTLINHLQAAPLFTRLGESHQREIVDYLRDKVDLLRVEPGQVIFRQGEAADHFYLVRLGFVKVSQAFHGQEKVLAYLGPGGQFGEIGLISRLSDLVAEALPSGTARGVRVATCTALDHVELVRVRGEHFRELLTKFPELQAWVESEAKRMLTENEQAVRALERPLGDFVANGLYQAKDLLVLDLERCTRCDECTKACSDTHDGITRLIREGLRFDRYLVATSCRSCLDPYCMIGCPVDSIHWGQNGEIQIEDWCIGCGLCAENCPYGNIHMVDLEQEGRGLRRSGEYQAKRRATTCDKCVDIDGTPSCVYACPHDAAHRMSGEKLRSMVEQPRSQ